jgi:hypothetical protein
MTATWVLKFRDGLAVQHEVCAYTHVPRIADPPELSRQPRPRGTTSSGLSAWLIVLLLGVVGPDDVRVMHPIAEFVKPVLGRPTWLVKRGHGSFVTAEFGSPELDVREPRLMPVFIEGAPAQTRQRYSFVGGEWHLWIYCCQWSLMLADVQLAHCESDDVTMHRALHVLNGQALSAVEIEPSDGRTRFSFDLGCTLLTLPAEAGVYDREPIAQWYLYGRSGLVLSVRGDGTYRINDRHQKRDDWSWQPIGSPVRLEHER